MYIEDVTKPFLVLENQAFSEEDYMRAHQEVYRYFLSGKKKKIAGICLAVLAGLLFIQIIWSLAAHRLTTFPIFTLLMVVLLLLFSFFILVLLPENYMERTKKAYNTSFFSGEKRTWTFYKDFFEINNQHEFIKFYRTDVTGCMENCDLFIFKRNDGRFIFIMKKLCTQEQASILRNYLKEIYVDKFFEAA